MTTDELIKEFERDKLDSTLGRIITKMVVIDPVMGLYKDGTLEKIAFRFDNGRTVTVAPAEVRKLSDQKRDAVAEAFQKGESG